MNAAFGFIAPEDGSQDVFIHKSTLTEPSLAYAGTLLQYEIVETVRGPQASDVLILGHESDETCHLECVVKWWSDSKGYGFVSPFNQRDDIHVGISSLQRNGIDHLRQGDVVKVLSFSSDTRGRSATRLEIIGWQKIGNAFDDDIALTDRDWPDGLASMAEPEPWDYLQTESTRTHPVLRQYIKYTYTRLSEMTCGFSFSSDGKFIAFNTGLVTPNQEEIFGVCRATEDARMRPWSTPQFYKHSSRFFVEKFGGNTPPLAEYFDDPSELIFDRRREIHVNIDHVMDNIDRFPVKLQDDPYVARQLLETAEKQTKKRVYRNYKAAIPQYFRNQGGGGEIQLLLPICLLRPDRADLALTVESNASRTAYLSSTVLTLDMAYNNARLLAKPDTEWLRAAEGD